MIDNIKNQLRIKHKNLRKAIPKSLKKQYDKQIFNNLLNCSCFTNADTVLTYISTDIEVDTHSIIRYCLINNIKIAVPKCINNHNINFYYYNNLTKLKKSNYGIYEPYGLENDLVTFSDNTVCIVPGLSFDLNGYRLGYGGGYYDRFLSKYDNLITIGLCYQDNISETLIINKFDKCVDYIVTENSLEVCNGQK